MQGRTRASARIIRADTYVGPYEFYVVKEILTHKMDRRSGK